jgi:ADP-dependent phosphofructokinase/glucokinase
MRWKQSLTPLDKVPHLDESTRSKLVENHITTAEELLGQIEAEPKGMSEMLDSDEDFVHELKQRVRAAIPAEAATAIEGQTGKDFPLGALPPLDEETD